MNSSADYLEILCQKNLSQADKTIVLERQLRFGQMNYLRNVIQFMGITRHSAHLEREVWCR